MQQNKEIREKAKRGGVPHWKIAARLGVSEFTLCRHLRVELSDTERERVLNVIEEIKNEEKEGE